MKVLWINEKASSQGGCETYIHNTAELLSKRGWSNYLIYHFKSRADKNFLSPFNGAFPYVPGQGQAGAIDPDLVFIHRWRGTGLVRELLRTGIPSVRMFHDHDLFCLRKHKLRPFTSRTCGRSVGISCLFCPGFLVKSDSFPHFRFAGLRALKKEISLNRSLDAFLVASRYMKEELVRHGFDADRIRRIPLFARTPVETNTKKDEKLILFVGQLVKGKGLDLLLEATSRIKTPHRLLVIGSGNQSAQLKKQAQAQDNAASIEFMDRVAQHELARYYAKALVVAVPSRVPETFCLVGPEAMSYGTAVVGADLGGIPDWLEHEVNGLLFEPYNTEQLARALERLLLNPSLAVGMGAAGRRMYSSEYTEAVYEERLAAALSAIAFQKKEVRAA